MEIWIRPSGLVAAPSSQRGGSESSRDSEQDGELVSLSASEVSLCFLWQLCFGLVVFSSCSCLFSLIHSW